MENLLKSITVVFQHVFGKWFPAFLQTGAGIIGDFLDAFGYAKAIIIGIFAALAALIAWIWKRMNR